MLDKDEWKIVHEQLTDACRAIEAEHSDGYFAQIAIKEAVRSDDPRFQPALDAYERITGVRASHPFHVTYHRLSLYGPPCRNCGKPLRTPEARLGAFCGKNRRGITSLSPGFARFLARVSR